MICRECIMGEEAGPFKKGNQSHKHRGIHKHCHTKIIRNGQKLKKALLRPSKWFQCDECDEIFYFKRYGLFLIQCPYCDSEEILTFKEMEKG